ncbi:MAG TPA: FeoA family protein [Candidatus Cloacimonas sp.]|jgi:Fe2+ transport system protein FeoA|nr:MAG: FeoA domain protein [Candidatus Cloacimonetes bacterium ADurb.Bin003]HPB18805.1 FeoA family protein [Candidatus Cloacimonas sp.]
MLSRRNRVRIRGWGRKFSGSKRHGVCKAGQCLPLDQLPEGCNAVVIHNNNLKIIERGLYIGAQISMFRNDDDEPNVVVAVGDARYVLDRRIAKTIKVKIV